MYAIIGIIYDIISTLYDNNPYYLWYHMHYTHYITCIIYDISSTLYNVTFTMCVTSHSDSIYDIKQYMFMTYSFVMASCTVLWPHSHCVYSQPLCLTLHSMYFDIKHIVPMLWKEVYVCHHSLYICMTPYALHMTSHPLFMISQNAMTFTHTVFMSSHPRYKSLHRLLLSSYI